MAEKSGTIESIEQCVMASFFGEMERQGPGSDDETRRALRFVPPLGINSEILDIGCGAGRQTVVLADETPAQILVVDLAPGLLETVERRTAIYGGRAQTLAASMDALPLEQGRFDLI